LIDPTETTPFNGTCSGYTAATNRDQWDCKTCLKGSKKCGFCAASDKVNKRMLIIIKHFNNHVTLLITFKTYLSISATSAYL